MGAETPEIDDVKHEKRLVVTKRFQVKMNEIQEIGYNLFGEAVAISFREKIFERILLVQRFPEMYPICPFIESTSDKQYRNIIFKKFYVIYSVTKTTIRIITIIHQSTNPEIISEIR